MKECATVTYLCESGSQDMMARVINEGEGGRGEGEWRGKVIKVR
jgi:hypothetical protein